jgi:hypothetical protein
LGRRGEYGTIQVREGVLESQLDGSEVIIRLGDTIGTQGVRRVKLVDVIGCFERHLYLHLHDVVEGVVRIPDIDSRPAACVVNSEDVTVCPVDRGVDREEVTVGTCGIRGVLEASRRISSGYGYVGAAIVRTCLYRAVIGETVLVVAHV